MIRHIWDREKKEWVKSEETLRKDEYERKLREEQDRTTGLEWRKLD